MIPTMEEARAILEPYHGLIRSVIDRAWGEWKIIEACRVDNGMSRVLYNRVICNHVHESIARIGIFEFAAEEGIRVLIEPQTFKLGFPGLLARIKKGDESHLGNNVPTQAVFNFVEADGFLPGISAETGKVEIIWLPNEIWTDIDRVLVVARDGNQLVWEYEIERSEPLAEIVPITTKPDPGSAEPPLIVPKKDPKLDAKKQ